MKNGDAGRRDMGKAKQGQMKIRGNESVNPRGGEKKTGIEKKAGSEKKTGSETRRAEAPFKDGRRKESAGRWEEKQGKSDGWKGNGGNRGNYGVSGATKTKSRCKAFGQCGGCQMIDLPYEEQLEQKQRRLTQLLSPFVKLEPIIGMENPEHYRNKVNAVFTHDKSGKALSGVYKEGSHYIIPIESCYLENEKADEIIGSIRGLLNSFKIKTYNEDSDYGLLRHVMVRVGHESGQIMVVLVLVSPILPSKANFIKALLKLQPDITTIIVNVNDKRTSMVLGDKEQVIYGKGYIEDTLCGKIFKISSKSFYQVNPVQTEILYQKAISYANLTGTEVVLDSYCGIGTIGIIAGEKAKRVIGVELNRDAVRDAIANAKMNNQRNMEFYQKDAGEFMVQLAEHGEQVDVVFMDPPRAGSDEVFLGSLAKLAPKKVVYVSCNPESLVRDMEYLKKVGYQVVKGGGVDMFPFTNKIEVACLLVRKP